MRRHPMILTVLTALFAAACGLIETVPPAPVPPAPTSELYVANNGNNSVTVYAATANGNIAPIRTISGGATGLNGPSGVALDGAGNLYVANFSPFPIPSHSVTVYAAGANGNVAPIRTISGAATGLNMPADVVTDGVGTLYVANNGGNTVTVYGAGATGNVFPIRTIIGAATGLSGPTGLTVDGVGILYVTNPVGVDPQRDGLCCGDGWKRGAEQNDQRRGHRP
ncbi:MAG: beta-propeller fold lactonase family protein [Armatimonadota bacterium]